jgi:hypothetical protein
MVSEKDGVKMIIALQKSMGIEESEESALAGWRAMTAFDQSQTELAYQAVVLRDPNVRIIGRR